MGTRKASSRWRCSDWASWPSRIGATCSVAAAVTSRTASPRWAQGCGAPTAVIATASSPATAQATQRWGTRAPVERASGGGGAAWGVGSVGWLMMGLESASWPGRAQPLSAHEAEAQELPPQEEPPQEEPPQEEPPQEEPPQEEPPQE